MNVHLHTSFFDMNTEDSVSNLYVLLQTIWSKWDELGHGVTDEREKYYGNVQLLLLHCLIKVKSAVLSEGG